MHWTTPATASLLLRIGLGVEFILFGLGKLVAPMSWVGFIPPWVTPLLPVPTWTFLAIIGAMELVLGALLLVGLWTRVVALLAALHLLSIVLAIGYNDLAVRDLVSFMAALALTAIGHASCHYSLDGRRAIPRTNQ